MVSVEKRNGFKEVGPSYFGKTFPHVKFEVFGEEMIEKSVKASGNNGRVYLPPDWIGKHVKIIRME
jgi:putative transposon-encoded protein